MTRCRDNVNRHYAHYVDFVDIGDVDLIVLIDAVASPTRLVQRMGRTGRKRDGRVVMLVCGSSSSSNSSGTGSSGHAGSKNTERDRIEKSATTAQAIYKALRSAGRSGTLHFRSRGTVRMIPTGVLPVLERRNLASSVDSVHLSQIAGVEMDNDSRTLSIFVLIHEMLLNYLKMLN